MFNKWQAQRWWAENSEKVMELYNVQRLNPNAFPPRSEDGSECSPVTPPLARERPIGYSSSDLSDIQSTHSGTGTSEASSSRDLETNQWVEEDQPGVYITIMSLPDGTREIKRVRFSSKSFDQNPLLFADTFRNSAAKLHEQLQSHSGSDRDFHCQPEFFAMSFLFGKRKTPAELLRENKRMLDKSIREIERERQGLQTQEKKLIAEIKKSAKQGQMGAVKVMAKDLIRTRHQIEKFYKLKSQLQGVSLRIQTLKSTQAMGEAMKGVTKAMGQMNRQMNLPSLQKIMQEFERQNEKMELTSEVMADAIDDALEGDEEEEETEELVNQVLDEIGIDINSELVNAPSSAVAAPASKNKVPQAEITGNDDGGIDSDLQASLFGLVQLKFLQYMDSLYALVLKYAGLKTGLRNWTTISNLF
ncbi:charged multivesicular body protein 2a [Striga asiatica]|uniref:Charged multivesicular body protein 2a n=1 Tax=Striga asiatica TaxID=4170 RepID=A0A5A7RIA5_STRAF|nr:charged multivesicular body protein 2a [Striga asiatica]